MDFSFRAGKGGLRLDKCVVQQRPSLSRAHVQKLIEEDLVTVNGQAVRSSYIVQPGDRIRVRVPAAGRTLRQEQIPLDIVYEDDQVLVIDKPAGLTVHPAPGHPSGTLVNAILAHIPELAAKDTSSRPGLVHRLDKDTSGLMVIARTAKAQENLVHQFKERTLHKKYIVLVLGRVSPEKGAIEAPVGRHPSQRQRMAVVEGGLPARTEYRVLRYLKGYTLLEASPVTGRTHQIRVHLAAIGHPVAGDKTYGGKSSYVPRQFVHASHLAFSHPDSGQIVEFSSDLPADLEAVLAAIPAA